MIAPWLLLAALLCSCELWKPTASAQYHPSPLPVGPLAIGAWLPAGLDQLRFGPQDQRQLAELGLTAVEWVQRAGQDSSTAEELVMEFCNRAGLQLPVYYEPRGYSPYDKLHNWAARPKVGPQFAAAVQERVWGLRQQWEGEAGFWGYLIGHEDYDRALYPALGATVEALRQVDGQRPALVVGNLDHYPVVEEFLDAFFAEGGPPNIFQHEHYIFREQVPISGAGLQGRLDELAAGYGRVAQRLQGRHGRWHAIVQAHAETRDGALFYRKPTPGELRVQAGMALARGAAGIIYFLYSSGVEEVRDGQGAVRQRRIYEGLVDAQGQPTERYFAARQLNAALRRVSGALEGLHFHGSCSARRLEDNPLVLRADADLDFGLFGDGERATHLLVVNRRPAEERRVALEVRASGVLEAPGGQALELRQGQLELELEAGGFRLLELQ